MRMNRVKKFPEGWRRILQAARSGTRDVILLQRCPECGGALRFKYTPAERATLLISCVSCPEAVATDETIPEPPWVAALGADFTIQQAPPLLYIGSEEANPALQATAPRLAVEPFMRSRTSHLQAMPASSGCA